MTQEELGDIVYVELPEIGSEVKHGEQFGVVESVKVSPPPPPPPPGTLAPVLPFIWSYKRWSTS